LRYGEEESRSQEEEKDDQEEVMRSVRMRARGSKRMPDAWSFLPRVKNNLHSRPRLQKTEATDKQKESFPATAEAFLFSGGRYFLFPIFIEGERCEMSQSLWPLL